MTSLTVVLPLPPNMANARMHWREKDRVRKAYWEHCDILSMVNNARAMVAEPATESARLAFVLHVGNRMDDDNALSRCKFATDWLVKRKFLVDDKPKWCRMSIPEQVITRDKSKQRVEITISYEDESDPEAGMIATDLTYGTKP